MQFVYVLATVFSLFGVAFGAVTFANGATATATITENSAAGTSLTTESATTNLAGESITYSIGAQVPASLYAIDTATGALTVASGQTIDAEAGGTFTVTVNGADSAATSNIVITVTVTDINDNTPAFGASLAGTLTASATTGTVGTYVASDDDNGAPNNAIASYALACTDTLEVSSSAVVTVKSGVTGPAAGCYSIVIIATDSGTNPSALTGSGTVSITVGGATCTASSTWINMCPSGSTPLAFSLMAILLGLLTNLMK